MYVLADTCSLIASLDSYTFVLETDASAKGFSGILSAIRDYEELLVGLYSRKLNAAEQNYAVTELESLAMVAVIYNLKFTSLEYISWYRHITLILG